MSDQITIFEFMDLPDKPAIGSIVYFTSSDRIIKAKVTKHEVMMATGIAPKYFEVLDLRVGTPWFINNYFTSKADAAASIKRYHDGYGYQN